MKLIVNGIGAVRTSLGARRYFDGVLRNLAWPDTVEITPLPRWRKLERPTELLYRGASDALFWSPGHRGPLFAKNHVLTVLDCINVEYVYRDDWRRPFFLQLFNAVLSNARAVVAISNATRDALLRNYVVDPEKVLVIPGPVNFRSDSERPVPPGPKGDASEPPFVLMITNLLNHKNTERACKAFAASRAARRGVGLRVVGSAQPEGLEACQKAGVTVEVRQGVSDAELDQWLTTCEFLLSPSLAEGLNLPIAEALSRNTGVVCSDIDVHREFYDGQAIFFDPLSVEEMTRALDEAFDRPRPWFSQPGRIATTFSDVAAQYRALFLRLSRDPHAKVGA